MPTTGSVSLDEPEGRVTVESLEIEDEELVAFLKQHDPEDRPEVISESLTIGLRTMQLMDTSQEVEYVERKLGELEAELTDDVETLQAEIEDVLGANGQLQQLLDEHVGENGTLEERIEAAFDDDGPFVERLDEELGENGERIQAALDPDNEGSPTYRLEQRLKDEIKAIREKIVEREARSELRNRTYLKGGDFEATVQQILEEIVRQTPNNVEYTGDMSGQLDRDVGDFVVTLANTSQKIAIEAKTESYSTQRIKDEMQEVLQNREADYGLFVTDNLENLPRTKTGWFHEFPQQDTVVVALRETTDQEFEPGYLRMAMHWARMRAVQAYAEVDSSFDPDQLQADLKEIRDSIDRFQTIRGHCTKINKSRNRIEETLDEIEQNVKQRVTNIEAELTKANND